MFKDIADPVHGLVRLKQVEAELLATRAMQRLHNVHQLGLAHMVFPGANYSRHAHSIGACHNSGRMLDAIVRNSDPKMVRKYEGDFDKYRIIALLHDVGHYPFSHATEHVIEEYFTAKPDGGGILSGSASIGGVAPAPAPREKQYSNHEEMGAFIIENDKEITDVLKKYEFNPVEISQRFQRSLPEYSPLSGVFSSDLDCDRLDYLRRTAICSGAPYGSVDINFLIDQAAVDCNGNFTFKSKAARSADHLLVSRFYDYMQIPFNKTAVALEWSLIESLKHVFKSGRVDPSSAAMQQKVVSGTQWHTFDDQCLIGIFRELGQESGIDALLKDHLDAISRRRPAKMLASWDALQLKEENTYAKHSFRRKALEGVVNTFCSNKGIDRDRFYVWETKVKFMKDESDDLLTDSDPAYFAEGVHILDERNNKAKRLIRRPDMLVHKLNDYYLSGMRAYYLPHADDCDDKINEIRQEFAKCGNISLEEPTVSW